MLRQHREPALLGAQQRRRAFGAGQPYAEIGTQTPLLVVPASVDLFEVSVGEVRVLVG